MTIYIYLTPTFLSFSLLLLFVFYRLFLPVSHKLLSDSVTLPQPTWQAGSAWTIRWRHKKRPSPRFPHHFRKGGYAEGFLSEPHSPRVQVKIRNKDVQVKSKAQRNTASSRSQWIQHHQLYRCSHMPQGVSTITSKSLENAVLLSTETTTWRTCTTGVELS